MRRNKAEEPAAPAPAAPAPTPAPPAATAPSSALAANKVTVGTETRQPFEGWGTTMCWWAGQVGGWSEANKKAILDLCFGPDGLGLTMVRFNIGGGENPNCQYGKGHMFEAREMPGYASAMTKTQSGADFTWTFDADKNQQNILHYLIQETVAKRYNVTFLEAFNNSPPYFMTISQCASGSVKGDDDNLPKDNYDAFADYMVGALKWFKDTHKIEFNSLSPFNEPSSWWWKAGGSQEGCAMSIKAQEHILASLDSKMKAAGLTKTELVASDDNCVDDCYDTYFRGKELDFKTRDGTTLKRINTHTYAGESIPPSERVDLFVDNKLAGRKLWMTEHSSGGNGPHNSVLMDGAIPLARTIMQDLKYMGAEAWIVWQVIESWKENFRIGQNWGCVLACYSDFPIGNEVFTKERFFAAKQYYVLKQYAHFIKPGSTIVACKIDPQPTPPDENISVIAATNPDGSLVIVAHNLTETDTPPHSFDLGDRFTIGTGATLERFRSSDELACQPVPGLALSGSFFTDVLPKRSVTTYRISNAPIAQGKIPAFDLHAWKKMRGDVKKAEKKAKKNTEKNHQ